MGARNGKCVMCEEDPTDGLPPTFYILPVQDPLGRGRIQRCDASKYFNFGTPNPKVLHQGNLCMLYIAKDRSTKTQVAVKQFPKSQKVVKQLRNEASVYLQVDHANICRLLHIYESETAVDVVMELGGPDLQMELSEKKLFAEGLAADMLFQMMQAVDYLHRSNIAHRNLKLEHWLCGTSGGAPQLKLIGFKNARKLTRRDEIMEEDVGTLAYACPELFSCRYTCKCDIWSLGIICYMLVVGKPPFFFPNADIKTKSAILNHDFPKDGNWKSLAGITQQLVTQLLNKSDAQRPDSSKALQEVKKWKSSTA